MKKNAVMFLTVGVLSLALVLAGLGNAAAADKIVLKLGNIQNVESPLAKGCVRFAELVGQKSNGRLDVQVYPSSQLGSAPDQLKGVSIGSQDMFVDGWSFQAALSKDWTILSTGFVLKDMEQVKKLLASDVGKALFEDLRAKSNIRVIGSNWYRGGRQLYSKRPIKSVADLSGVKIRVPNKTYFLTWKQLGAAPTILDWGETYGALQQGVVDATEVPISDAYTSKIFEVVKNVTMINYIPQAAPLVMNDKKFQSLSPELQKVILDAAKEAGDYMSKLQIDSEREYIAQLKKAGIAFYTPDIAEWIAKAKPLPIKLEEDGAWSKGLYERLQAAVK
ncbi:MAG: TRAP transporter substrate-binding protein [Deltaproteobacteria bacterium]|nr:TRAP transporter substrate-binding protein [Deltaproteobacteria bacterium]